MRRTIYIMALLAMTTVAIGLASNTTSYFPEEKGQPVSTDSLGTCNEDSDERFSGWTEEQYQQYEDSIKAVLYPSAIPVINDNGSSQKRQDDGHPIRNHVAAIINPYVPNSIILDKNKPVGEIPVESGSTPSGAKTYRIPLNLYHGMHGMQPDISLLYNSQAGQSVVGMGWSIGGLSTIARCQKSIYYDNTIGSVALNNNDAFVLDGMRLIKKSTNVDYILYESETGNVKVKGYIGSNIIRYFEVFYPDGRKGIFGYSNNSVNQLFYPLTSISDLKGNTITYNYVPTNNHYNISSITYNNSSVVFQYDSSRPDPLVSYVCGRSVREDNLLKSITCKLGSTTLCTYSLSHTSPHIHSLLSQVDYTAGNTSFNPIRFYYGSGNSNSSFSEDSVQLSSYYYFESKNAVVAQTVYLDYNSGIPGMVVYPNKNPYYKHYRHSTWFQHSENSFSNGYESDDQIFVYKSLGTSSPIAPTTLYAETGFIQTISADLLGNQNDYLIKVNNYVLNGQDHLTFKAYAPNSSNGLSLLWTRTYNFSTVYTDNNDNESIQPKFYHVGDFNGDGKMEILAVAAHQPFDNPDQPGINYLFNLNGNSILYQGSFMQVSMDFVGTQQTDPRAAENNSDKVFAIDYDGDGKTDICHIHAGGMDVYTFDVSGSTLTPRQVGTFTGLTRAMLENRDIQPGDFNGDGQTDLVVSCVEGNTSSVLSMMFLSKGNGQFVRSDFENFYYNQGEERGVVLQDVNGDGQTDINAYNSTGFSSLLAGRDLVGLDAAVSDFHRTHEVLVPANFNTRSSRSRLVALKNGTVTMFQLNRDDRKEAMISGMANSLGVVEKNEYNRCDDLYLSPDHVPSESYTVSYPYVIIHEPLQVLTATELYLEGSPIDYNSFFYDYPVFHRTKKSFCGFRQVTHVNKRGQASVQTFDPKRFGILIRSVTPESSVSNDYSVTIASDKVAKIRLTNKTENDLLKNITATSAYTYDTYGYPTVVNTSYTGGITVKTENTYASTTTVGDGYNLGFLTDSKVTTTRSGNSYVERTYITSHAKRLPFVVKHYKNGSQVRQCSYTYDQYGNIIAEVVIPYTSANSQTTSFLYNSNGRPTKETNPLGLVTEYTYNTFGQVATKQDAWGTTTYAYDAFGRQTSATHADGTVDATALSWISAGTNGLYASTHTQTGKPTTRTVYDALKREVRTSDMRFNGIYRNVDKLYDTYGNLQKVSLPYKTGNPLWNTYAYDSHNRLTSVTEASSRQTTYSYSGNSVTTTEDGIATTRTYDAQGNLISASDPSGTVTYNLAADGQPTSIVAPGGVTTSFAYDQYRRRTSLTDPSSGTTSYQYDAAGNVKKETDANGKVITRTYDAKNRLTKTVTPELTANRTYNAKSELTSVTTSTGVNKTFTYDAYGRLSTWKETVDSVWLKKQYTYAGGNVSAITYTTHTGLSQTENYTYTHGHWTEGKMNGSTSVYKLTAENTLGLPTTIATNKITRQYAYNAYGLPTRRKANKSETVILDFSYTFDPATHNLLSRKDNTRNLTETFTYDNLNRLTGYADNTATYDTKGNLTSKSDVGTFDYTHTAKPYAITGVTLSGSTMPTTAQSASNTSFRRPLTFRQGNDSARFVYDGDLERVKMQVTRTTNGSKRLTRYYLGDCYEIDYAPGSRIEKLYLFGDYYNASSVYYKYNNWAEQYYNILRDYLGSITHITFASGNLRSEQSYDAWGRLRDPETHAVDVTNTIRPLLGRGYTGHEFIPYYGLVNMNARLYDPAVGRFLSPDPFVQTPDNPQNFNRYSYCLNNPLKYTDPSGELFIIDDWIWGGIKGLLTGHNFFRSANQHAENSFNIWKGLFSYDSNKSFWWRAWEMVSRFTWQGFQTELGFLAAHGFNTFGAVEKVESRYGTTVLTTKNMPGTSAFTLGNYIVGNRHTEADPNNSTFQHEYGHYLQSQSMGPFYVPLVAVPSFTSAVIAKDGNHRYSSYERDANYRAFMYFNKYVEGFYNTYEEVSKHYFNSERRGWDFANNPLAPNSPLIYSSTYYYVDYKDDEILKEIENSIDNIYRIFH